MVHTTLNPFHGYFCMIYVYHKSSRDYIWSQLGLRYMVKMTNIWQFGGPKSMQGNPWLGMISSRYKTLLIWTKNTRRVNGGYIGTRQILFNHRYVFTQMMFFKFKAHVRWGFKSSSTLGSKHLCNSRKCSNYMIIRLFVWMPHLASLIWSTISSHWWHLSFIALRCRLLGSSPVDKLAKIWWNGWFHYGPNL
jgi:hypothetical protein